MSDNTDAACKIQDVCSATSEYKELLLDVLGKVPLDTSSFCFHLPQAMSSQTTNIRVYCFMRCRTNRIGEFFGIEKDHLENKGIRYQHLILLGAVSFQNKNHEQVDEPIEDENALCLTVHVKRDGSRYKLHNCNHNTDSFSRLEKYLEKCGFESRVRSTTAKGKRKHGDGHAKSFPTDHGNSRSELNAVTTCSTNKPDDECIMINAGGKTMTTKRSTVNQEPEFEKLLDKHKFLDCDPTYISIILNYLRAKQQNGNVNPDFFPRKLDVLVRILETAKACRAIKFAEEVRKKIESIKKEVKDK